MKDPKEYRSVEIKWYILAYLFFAISILYVNPNFFQGLSGDFLKSLGDLMSSAFLSGVICTLAFVIDSLYPSEVKDAMLFYGRRKMPGNTIFSRIKNGFLDDFRIDISVAENKYKEIIDAIPEEKNTKKDIYYENGKWYLIYLKHQDSGAVLSTHRDFLLCRDLVTTTITLFAVTIIMMGAALIPFRLPLIVYLICMFVITNFAACNKANRFVNTVIAVDMEETK